MNPSAQRMLGRDLSELRGEAFTSFLHPDDRAQDAELFHELAAGRREGYEHDLRYVRKDGGSGFMHLKVSLVRDFDAKPHFALAMIVDMTERKTFRAASAASAEDGSCCAVGWGSCP